jgi:acetyl-CoA C-acetyltransferase
MSKAKADELGLTWLAEIGAHGMVAGPDSTLQMQPARATAKALEKEGITAADLGGGGGQGDALIIRVP